MPDQAPSLALIQHKMDQMIRDHTLIRGEMRVQAALLMRIDTTMAALLTEVRRLP